MQYCKGYKVWMCWFNYFVSTSSHLFPLVSKLHLGTQTYILAYFMLIADLFLIFYIYTPKRSLGARNKTHFNNGITIAY